MCSGSKAGSYVRLIDFVYHSTLGLRVIKKKKKMWHLLFPETLDHRRIRHHILAHEEGDITQGFLLVNLYEEGLVE